MSPIAWSFVAREVKQQESNYLIGVLLAAIIFCGPTVSCQESRQHHHHQDIPQHQHQQLTQQNHQRHHKQQLADQKAQNVSRGLLTIETAVFIDDALSSRYGGVTGGLSELNKLVMTIMSQVRHLFSYSSLKQRVTIKLVLIEQAIGLARFGNESAWEAAQLGDIDAYLGQFCAWQQWRLDQERKGLWWDHAILLSGLDLYKTTSGKNHSGVLGLAWVGGMCKANYSCTINEAANLESAFVIAHELGHSLGILHDGRRNGCDPNGFIMSERTGAGKMHWSSCSNTYLNQSLVANQLTCLTANSSSPTTTQTRSLDLSQLDWPGRVMGPDEQCQVAFGLNYSAFLGQQAPFNSICRELWCLSGSWARAAHPALDGSGCDRPPSSNAISGSSQQGRMCIEGRCVEIS